jgi:hypothetical protein
MLRYDEPTDLIGQTVCQYRVLDVLGCGEMGVVYPSAILGVNTLTRTVRRKFSIRAMKPAFKP